MSKTKNSHDRMLAALESSGYIKDTYSSFVRSSATPSYFQFNVVESQDVLQLMRSVLGLIAEREEYWKVIDNNNKESLQEFCSEAGDVLFWGVSAINICLRYKAEWVDAWDTTDTVEIIDTLEKWSRNPTEKTNELNNLYRSIVWLLYSMLVDYFSLGHVDINDDVQFQCAIEELAVSNINKLLERQKGNK